MENRARLLSSARAVFARKTFTGATVDDILRGAGLGRTSFYKHFPDKLAVAVSLFEEFMPEMASCYAEIAAEPEVDIESVSRWMFRLIDAYRRNAGIMIVFAQVMVVEPRFSQTIADVQQGLMAMLAERFEPFDKAAQEASNAPLRTRAALVLSQIDFLCSAIGLRDAPLDKMAAVHFVAESFLRFVREE